jgi:hypothetical protein
MHRWLMATDRILLFVANCWIQIFISIYQRLGIENCYSSSFQNRQKPIDKPEKTTDKPFLLQYPLRFFLEKPIGFCNRVGPVLSVFATEPDLAALALFPCAALPQFSPSQVLSRLVWGALCKCLMFS